MTPQELRQKANELRQLDEGRNKENFALFMDSPLVKILVSQIPPPDHAPEALHTLLLAAFEAGSATGSTTFMLAFTEHFNRKD
jgi:hypothetical protein